MHRFLTPAAAALFALSSITHAEEAAPERPLAGYDRMEVASPHRAWKLQTSVWYPAGARTYVAPVGDNPIFHGTPMLIGPKVAEGRFPLVLFSHGSGGNMDNMGWLLSGLAQRGAMVLAVNHPGSTSGDSSPRRSLHLDDRARDLSAALDALMAEPAFARHVDTDRITAIGFSLGGATALGLAGMELDAERYAPYCDGSDTTRTDCAFFAKGGVDFANLPEGFSAKTRDARVTAAVAIDPAFTYVATAESLGAMDLPVMLVNLGQESRLSASDVSDMGSGFAGQLADVAYHEVARANHFTALPECKPMAPMLLAEEGEDPICDDPEGADRAAVHHEVLREVAGFLNLQ